MKIKINIELFDDTPASKIEEIGLTTKFLEIVYKEGFTQYIKSLCEDSPEMNYSISTEVEDNTIN